MKFDTDWRWDEFEGWLPVEYLGEESGLELMTGDVRDNADFAVENRPELQCLLELTVRGGLHSNAVAYAFAGIVTELSNGELDLDEEPNLAGADAWEWVAGTLRALEEEIGAEAKRKDAFNAATESSKPPRILLNDALQRMVGQKIAWCGASLGFRTEDQSMVFGSRCEIRKSGRVLIEHGLGARLNDKLVVLTQRYLPDLTDDQVDELEKLQKKLTTEKDKDAAIETKSHAIMNQWIDKVRIEAVELLSDDGIDISLSDGYSMQFVTEGSFSSIHVITGGIKYLIQSGEIQLSQAPY